MFVCCIFCGFIYWVFCISTEPEQHAQPVQPVQPVHHAQPVQPVHHAQPVQHEPQRQVRPYCIDRDDSMYLGSSYDNIRGQNKNSKAAYIVDDTDDSDWKVNETNHSEWDNDDTDDSDWKDDDTNHSEWDNDDTDDSDWKDDDTDDSDWKDDDTDDSDNDYSNQTKKRKSVKFHLETNIPDYQKEYSREIIVVITPYNERDRPFQLIETMKTEVPEKLKHLKKACIKKIRDVIQKKPTSVGCYVIPFDYGCAITTKNKLKKELEEGEDYEMDGQKILWMHSSKNIIINKLEKYSDEIRKRQ